MEAITELFRKVLNSLSILHEFVAALSLQSLADPGGAPGARPPNGRGLMPF